MRPMTKKKQPVGRPAKITLSVVDKVGELMALGIPEEHACALCGVNAATFGPAVSRSEAFKAALKLHHARFMARALKGIAAGGEVAQFTDQDDNVRDVRLPWQGLAWILERRYKPHFNKTEVHKDKEADGERGGLLTAADMAELERIMRAEVIEGERLKAEGSRLK